MNCLRHSDADFDRRLEAVAAESSLFDPVVEERTRGVVDAVRERGDEAVVDLTERFDGVRLEPSRIRVSTAELLNASLAAEPALRAAVAEADRNVAVFARKSLRKAWQARNSHGAAVGGEVGVRSGGLGSTFRVARRPLVSTAIMTVTLARVAGCPEIVVCTTGTGRDGQSGAAVCGAHGRGHGDLQDRRRKPWQRWLSGRRRCRR